MARTAQIQIIRTSRANLNYQKSVGNLCSGELYFISDENKLAVGIAVDDYVDTGGSSGSGHTIQDEGSSLSSRSYLDFIGYGVTASDDSANNKTKITVSVNGKPYSSVLSSLSGIDCSLGNIFYVELTGNSSFSFSNMVDDVFYTFIIKAISTNITITIPTGDIALASTVNISNGGTREFSVISSTAGGTTKRRWQISDIAITV